METDLLPHVQLLKEYGGHKPIQSDPLLYLGLSVADTQEQCAMAAVGIPGQPQYLPIEKM